MSDGTGAAPPAIELRGIVKRFPGVVANDHVNLRVMPGTIHAIVGENGAGKSTLMKVLYGSLKPDEGTITVNGIEQHFKSAKDAIAVGHRHGVPALHAGRQPHGVGEHRARRRARADRPARHQARPGARSSSWASATACASIPDELIGELGVGARQRVEILKVLYRGARIIILDEPTAVLVPQEVDELFAVAPRARRRRRHRSSSSPTSSTRC